MLIPLEWLREYVPVPDDVQALADRLTETGNEIEETRESPDGPVLYLKLTPNRPDMLSLRGVAREVAALYGLPAPREEVPDPGAAGPPADDVAVAVDAPDLCPRYVARVIRGVRVGPSPDWLVRRLEAAGMRSVSNVVDATNYVMLEMGQPLHAFDLDTLEGRRIVVRRARAGESIELIDGTSVRLEPEMLVIADAVRPVAIAGVMGGRATEVTAATRDVLLESACFDPASVRRTARRVGAATAASYRFERGVDPLGTLAAADRAAALIAELAGGVVSSTVRDVCPRPWEPPAIPFCPDRCSALLGVEIPAEEAAAALERLGLRVTRREGPWEVRPPGWRPDLRIEEDLIEEVGRLHGYDRLPETLPATPGCGKLSPQERLSRRVRDLLTAQGLYEAVGNTLVARSFLDRCRLPASPVWAPGEPVALRNPLSEEFDTLRPSLLPGLLLAAQRNLRRGARSVYLFEIGYATAGPPGGDPVQRVLAAGLLLGSRMRGWNVDPAPADFFTARGTVETLLRGLGAPEVRSARSAHPAFHPGRAAELRVEGRLLGVVGELHPEVAEAADLPRGVYLFELDGELLMEYAERPVRYEPPSRFPAVLRDLAVVVGTSVPCGEVEEALREVLGAQCRGISLFDAYQGPPLAEGTVSLAFSVELGADDRTLTDEEVDAALGRAREVLGRRFGAALRQ